MKTILYSRPTRVSEAVERFMDPDQHLRYHAGGIDNVDLLKEGLIEPDELVSIRRIQALSGISVSRDKSCNIGALTTLSEISEHPWIQKNAAALASAAGQAATPNIRNVATVGGNLLQQPRCSYFRSELASCVRKGGDGCPAHRGEHAYHGIFENGTCAAVLPSSLAIALVALEATCTIAFPSEKESEQRPISSLFASPLTQPENHIALPVGALIQSVTIPAPRKGSKNAYVKLKPRQSFDWPMVEAACALRIDAAGKITHCRIVLGAVALTPWRATQAETTLLNQPLREGIEKASTAAAAGATPLQHNGYKAELCAVATRRILQDCLDS